MKEMQIQELLRLIIWFQKNIVDKKIPNNYQNLQAKLNQNARANSNQPKQPFEAERKQLFDSIGQVDIKSLTLEQIDFLKQLEVIDLSGIEGVKKIEAVLFENNLDIATAAKKIGEFTNKMNSAVASINEIDQALSKLFLVNETEEILDDSIMMRVYFQDGVAINNVTDFKKLGATWHDIGRGIAMAQDKSPEDFKIIGAQKGSIIIEMSIIPGLAITVCGILLQALKVAERVLEIQCKAEELKGLKLTNKKIEQDIKKEADNEKNDGIQKILDATIEQLELRSDVDGEKVAALKKSITKLVEFTGQGGAVDVIEPENIARNGGDEYSNRTEFRKITENVQEIRQLERKIRMLESKNEKKE